MYIKTNRLDTVINNDNVSNVHTRNHIIIVNTKYCYTIYYKEHKSCSTKITLNFNCYCLSIHITSKELTFIYLFLTEYTVLFIDTSS